MIVVASAACVRAMSGALGLGMDALNAGLMLRQILWRTTIHRALARQAVLSDVVHV